MISAALNLRLLKKLCPGMKIWGYFMRGFAACAMCCAFGRLLMGILQNYMPAIWSMIVCGVLLAAFGAATFLLFKTYSLAPLKDRLLKRRKVKNVQN